MSSIVVCQHDIAVLRHGESIGYAPISSALSSMVARSDGATARVFLHSEGATTNAAVPRENAIVDAQKQGMDCGETPASAVAVAAVRDGVPTTGRFFASGIKTIVLIDF